MTKEEFDYKHSEIHEWLTMWGRLLAFGIGAQIALAIFGKWQGVMIFCGFVIIICLIRIHLMFKHDFLMMEWDKNNGK